jgi:hypothetical protein
MKWGICEIYIKYIVLHVVWKKKKSTVCRQKKWTGSWSASNFLPIQATQLRQMLQRSDDHEDAETQSGQTAAVSARK